MSRCVGSPPRAWGQFPQWSCLLVTLRFTPTRVGTMSIRPGVRFSFPVHPHARGDNATASVPRHGGTRFTPTRVGTMPDDAGRNPHDPVHPHARGDNRTTTACATAIVGSPPRAWGQWWIETLISWFFRFTPTRVGTMESATSWQKNRHGSPPRAWGQCSAPRRALSPGRFTPTRVGTMSCRCIPPRRRAVHPHARGDNLEED